MRVNVDGIEEIDAQGNYIKYIGDAVQHEDYTWICLANVNGMLCRVQVKITAVPK